MELLKILLQKILCTGTVKYRIRGGTNKCLTEISSYFYDEKAGQISVSLHISYENSQERRSIRIIDLFFLSKSQSRCGIFCL